MMSGGRFVDTTWGDVWERLGALTKDTNKIVSLHAVFGSRNKFFKKYLKKMGALKKLIRMGI